MKEVEKKYVYELNSLENYHGMIPLEVYITFTFFNNHTESFKKDYLNLNELINFLTECVVEMFTVKTSINLNEKNAQAKDFYISSFYDVVSKKMCKTLIFKFDKKDIFVSESSYGNSTSLPMKDISKNLMLRTIMGCHKFVISMVQEIIDRCNNSKKLNIIGINGENNDEQIKLEEEKEEKIDNKINKFDMKNYEPICYTGGKR